MRVFSGIRASGDKTLGNYSGGFRQYLQTQDEALAAGGEAFFCVVDLHSITTPFEPDVLRESTLSVFAWLIATGVDPAVDGVRAEPRPRAPRGRVASRRSHGVRRAPPDDAVQGPRGGAGLRLGGPLHLSGADGGRHPALPHRRRSRRRRPAAARRVDARHRGALQPALRRDARRAARRVPRGGLADQEPPGTRTPDVDDTRTRRRASCG